MGSDCLNANTKFDSKTELSNSELRKKTTKVFLNAERFFCEIIRKFNFKDKKKQQKFT